MLAQDVGIHAPGSLSKPQERRAHHVLEPGPLARLAARLRPDALDRQLIAGRDPSRSPQLAARAATLTSTSSRQSLADAIERVLELAQARQSRTRVLPPRRATLASASHLRDLAAVLRGGSPVYARGIAIAARLLSDATWPLYMGERRELERCLEEARRTMAGGEPNENHGRPTAIPVGRSYRLQNGAWIHGRRDSA
jgi:hypothetical protein